MDDAKKKLRAEYKTLTGKNANGFWTAEKIQEEVDKIKVEAREVQVKRELSTPPDFKYSKSMPDEPKPESLGKIIDRVEEVTYNTEKWKELPPPIQEHLKKNFGNWLNYFEVGQQYKSDFGGYGMYIRVPKEFSTEWHEEMRVVYDNRTRSAKVDANGNQVMQKVVTEDIRWKSLKDIADAIKWINLVKDHIIKNAYSKGIQLPNTNAPMDETRKTMDDYRASLHK